MPAGRPPLRRSPAGCAGRDVSPSGRLKLDVLAGMLEDVAGDDVDDVGIRGAWVLRRVAVRFGDLPRFSDRVDIATFCSGTGARWAERRTTVSIDGRVAVEAVAVWVYLDADGRPTPLEGVVLRLVRRRGQRADREQPPPPLATRRGRRPAARGRSGVPTSTCSGT